MENICVLYVDDEENNLFLFECMFRDRFDVVTAKSGFEGLIIIESNQEINVVLSDVKMPGMSGIEFIEKAYERFPHLVYLVLTGFDITNEINKAISNGLVRKYIQKPFVFQDIEQAIVSNLH